MKITHIALLMCLVLSSMAFATDQAGATSTTFVAVPTVMATTTTTTSATVCRTDADLTSDMKACEAKSFRYSTYAGQDGCKYVKCYDKQINNCPSEDEVARMVVNCPDKYVTTTDQNNCKVRYCSTTTSCPTEEEAMSKVANCPDAYAWTTDQQGCKMPYCAPTTTCPSNVEEQIMKCKAANLDYETYGDSNGCKQVSCRNNDKVECKKYVSNGCVIFSCNDGYVLNLCDYCQPTCKVYTDQEGCIVKDCGNGQSSKACPTTSGGVAPAPTVTQVATTSTATQISTPSTPNAEGSEGITTPSTPVAEGSKGTINPQPEPPKPASTKTLNSKPVQNDENSGTEKPSDSSKTVEPNSQPEPPVPAGFWEWFKGMFK